MQLTLSIISLVLAFTYYPFIYPVSESSSGGTSVQTKSSCGCSNSPRKPVDCVMSSWGTWSQCDKPCNGGKQKRTRDILNRPTNNGAKCPELHI